MKPDRTVNFTVLLYSARPREINHVVPLREKGHSVNEGPLSQILVTVSSRIFGFIYSMLFPMVSL